MATLVLHKNIDELSIRHHTSDVSFQAAHDNTSGYCITHPGKPEAQRIRVAILPAATITAEKFDKKATGSVSLSDFSVHFGKN